MWEGEDIFVTSSTFSDKNAQWLLLILEHVIPVRHADPFKCFFLEQKRFLIVEEQ